MVTCCNNGEIPEKRQRIYLFSERNVNGRTESVNFGFCHICYDAEDKTSGRSAESVIPLGNRASNFAAFSPTFCFSVPLTADSLQYRSWDAGLCEVHRSKLCRRHTNGRLLVGADAPNPTRTHGVLADYISFALPQAAEFIHSVARPFPAKLRFVGTPPMRLHVLRTLPKQSRAHLWKEIHFIHRRL